MLRRFRKLERRGLIARKNDGKLKQLWVEGGNAQEGDQIEVGSNVKSQETSDTQGTEGILGYWFFHISLA